MATELHFDSRFSGEDAYAEVAARDFARRLYEQADAEDAEWEEQEK